MKYYLGLDNGGTTTKAALFDEQGHQLVSAAEATPAVYPQPGFAELDMEQMWQANARVIQAVLKDSHVAPDDIRAVGVCGHGKGLYLWGWDQKPVRAGILSADCRALEYETSWRTEGTEKKVFDLTCQHIMACQPAPLFAWLRDHEAEALAKTRYVFSCKDYIRFRLTSEAFAERSDCSGNGLLNLYTREYDERILSLLGLAQWQNKLPPLVEATQICGCITETAARETGLAEGTPVCGGMFDIDACALSAALTDTEHICMVAGTWSINELILRQPVTDGSVRMNSLFCVPGFYLVEESSATSAGNLAWYLRHCVPKMEDIYSVINAEAASVGADESVPIFLPFILGSNVNPRAKGSFVGVRAEHTRAHMIRSVYEGIAFCHRWHWEKLRSVMAGEAKSIRLVGGAARSALWVQIFADVMKQPVEVSEVEESGAHGCAIAAAVAVGDQPDLETAVQAMTHLREPVMPQRKNAAAYDRKYTLYKRVIEALDPVWELF